MKLKNIANKNQLLKALYAEISEWAPIISQKGKDNCWAANLNKDGKAVITYVKTNNQLAALAHELLHFKVQKEGYKRLACSVIKDSDKFFVKILFDALDNELQHHKMYPLYLEMGFLPKDFYNDDDVHTKTILNEALESNVSNIRELISNYFTLIAPGGRLKSKEIAEYKLKFREKINDSSCFDIVDTEIEQWKKSNSMDAKSTIRAIFHSIEKPTKTWVGYDNGSGFPDSGFFIGDACEMSEFE